MRTALPVLLLFLDGVCQRGLQLIRHAPYVPLRPTLCRVENPRILSSVTISGTMLGPGDRST